MCYRNAVKSNILSTSSNDHSIIDERSYSITTGMSDGVHVFLINGEYKSMLMLNAGTMYTFDQTPTSCGPLGFSTISDGRADGSIDESKNVSEGLTYFLEGIEVTQAEYKAGFVSGKLRKIMFTPVIGMNIYYYCNNMMNMGGTIMIH